VASKVQVPVEEYLRTSYDGPDREYLDGEVVERNVGNNPHSEAQWRLSIFFGELCKRYPVHGRPELRVRVGERRYRVIDLAVYTGERPSELVPSSPPLIAIEILSPDDRMAEMLDKLREYRRWGVRHVWLVDPEARVLYSFDEDGLRETSRLDLPEFSTELSREQVF
jgi:Uma2 family endonuclease